MINRLAELRRQKENGEGGFTLIELLVVVVIIGILMAIAVPLYLNYRQGANDKAAQSDVRAAISAIEQCNSDSATGTYPASVGQATGDCKVAKSSAADAINYKLDSGNYRVYAKATNGTGLIYCYSSAAGGSVSSSKTTPAAASTACP